MAFRFQIQKGPIGIHFLFTYKTGIWTHISSIKRLKIVPPCHRRSLKHLALICATNQLLKFLSVFLTWTRAYFYSKNTFNNKYFSNGPIKASFVLFTSQTKYKLEKCRCCAWDSNLELQDGRCRRIHWAMAATINILFQYLIDNFVKLEIGWDMIVSVLVVQSSTPSWFLNLIQCFWLKQDLMNLHISANLFKLFFCLFKRLFQSKLQMADFLLLPWQLWVLMGHNIDMFSFKLDEVFSMSFPIGKWLGRKREQPLLNFTSTTQSTWSSGYGRRLTLWRSWVRIPKPYTRWILFQFNLL